MENENVVLMSVLAAGLAALVGFFVTKAKGFGRFSTSVLLLLLVLVLSSLLYAANKLDAQVLVNIFFAVVGFAGGLLTGKETPDSTTASGR